MESKGFIKNNLEVVYAILLILLIPLIIIINSLYTTKFYKEAIDDSINRQVLETGRNISIIVQENLNNYEKLQNIIDKLAKRNTSIVGLDIFVPDKDNFRLVASLNKKEINNLFNSPFLVLAWQQPVYDGLARITSNIDNITIDRPNSVYSDEERFWVVGLPIKDNSGKKAAILSIKTSSKVIDDLAGRTARTSFVVIIFTSLVLILLLSVNTRLFQYSILYTKIKEVDKMKDEFISIASHELRTPVTAIRGYISLIIDGIYGRINKKVKDVLKKLDQEAERLAVLVDDLLNVSRIEQKRINIDLKMQDINPLIKEVVESLQSKAEEKKLTIKVRLHSKKTILNIDSDRFRQILVNLIGNAIKYTPKGSVEVITEKADDNIKIIVKDTGIGMSAEQRKRLFEKFYRVQSDKTKNIPGTGLGLWITKQLVELMGGKIYVDSMENVGTQVTLVFPDKKQ